ncbi:hypothetical protein AK812_SmicGene39277 [Symbiodinium microadriaticum]|uniref:Uncharacterized protein n=1 Tax=Symbiodinium microadriaticum TaxID=2951 RepID=A0A1Q9CBN5_SYMMI|nr:hypothetical protein AK812_SmicGene39277 [Symbiodinium microadriaticum]
MLRTLWPFSFGASGCPRLAFGHGGRPLGIGTMRWKRLLPTAEGKEAYHLPNCYLPTTVPDCSACLRLAEEPLPHDGLDRRGYWRALVPMSRPDCNGDTFDTLVFHLAGGLGVTFWLLANIVEARLRFLWEVACLLTLMEDPHFSARALARYGFPERTWFAAECTAGYAMAQRCPNGNRVAEETCDKAVEVRQAERSKPGELLQLFGEVGEATLVQRAFRHNLKELSLELTAYCVQARGLARQSSNGDDVLKARAGKVEAHLRDLETLQRLFVEAEEDFNSVSAWFHEGCGKKPRPPDEFFGYWHTFFQGIRSTLEGMYAGKKRRKAPRSRVLRPLDQMAKSLSLSEAVQDLKSCLPYLTVTFYRHFGHAFEPWLAGRMSANANPAHLLWQERVDKERKLAKRQIMKQLAPDGEEQGDAEPEAPPLHDLHQCMSLPALGPCGLLRFS